LALSSNSDFDTAGTKNHLTAFPVAIVPGEWPKAGAFAPNCGLLFPQFWQRASRKLRRASKGRMSEGAHV
jgi:hypothetical protein